MFMSAQMARLLRVKSFERKRKCGIRKRRDSDREALLSEESNTTMTHDDANYSFADNGTLFVGDRQYAEKHEMETNENRPTKTPANWKPSKSQRFASTPQTVIMEGTLSKWTNMVHGWQMRYFVLNDESLCYFTSREKMLRGQPRGCIRLNGAAVGIDGENEATFTIKVDGKTFHLQGVEKAERDEWVRELERVIHIRSGYYRPRPEEPLIDLKNRVKLADRQLQDLIELAHKLEQAEKHVDKVDKVHEKKKRHLNEILLTAKRLQSTVEHSCIILKQVQSKFPVPDAPSIPSLPQTTSGVEAERRDSEKVVEPLVHPPQITYSSSEDEFFDAASALENESDSSADDYDEDTEECPTDCTGTATDGSTTGSLKNFNGDQLANLTASTSKRRHKHRHRKNRRQNSGDDEMTRHAARRHSRTSKQQIEPTSGESAEPDWGDADEDFDQIYECTDESDLGNVQQQHGSVLMHLLSQVSVGMDLTKVTLPTFILERRSLLEMYADFFAHPDDFVKANELQDPEERFVSVVRYYMNAFYPARKSGVAKKPYNPILGETFRCRWTVPELPLSGQKTKSGPFPGSDINQVTFVAEQVSHHPPVSAFYAEHPASKISLAAHIWTQSSFLGLSIGVANVGNAKLTLQEFNETYTITFPNGYGRSILGKPWVELGGKVEVRCPETGYHAEIEFQTKPIFGGKPHKIAGSVFKRGLKKPIMTLRGEWNGVIYAKRTHGDEFQFTDVKEKPEIKKECDPIAAQSDRESRRLWRHVTAALYRNRIEIASSAKRFIEQRQRDEAKTRRESGEEYQQNFPQKSDELKKQRNGELSLKDDANVKAGKWETHDENEQSQETEELSIVHSQSENTEDRREQKSEKRKSTEKTVQLSTSLEDRPTTGALTDHLKSERHDQENPSDAEEMAEDETIQRLMFLVGFDRAKQRGDLTAGKVPRTSTERFRMLGCEVEEKSVGEEWEDRLNGDQNKNLKRVEKVVNGELTIEIA
ncbi:Oxysterol-binding protein-related protein 9 [Aphelenchoides besseyi]|nr:Oxysterol-binding protein-related protein 9 [Aphelenchoides besseyi]